MLAAPYSFPSRGARSAVWQGRDAGCQHVSLETVVCLLPWNRESALPGFVATCECQIIQRVAPPVCPSDTEKKQKTTNLTLVSKPIS